MSVSRAYGSIQVPYCIHPDSKLVPSCFQAASKLFPSENFARSRRNFSLRAMGPGGVSVATMRIRLDAMPFPKIKKYIPQKAESAHDFSIEVTGVFSDFSHFPREFSLSFHIFQGSLELGNNLSIILAIFLHIAEMHCLQMFWSMYTEGIGQHASEFPASAPSCPF